MIKEDAVDAYLNRIGAARPSRPDLAGLRTIQDCHARTVPFENLDYHFGREILMDERVLPKIIDERRGGGCYEVNPALYALLEALGYSVRMLQGRVWIKGELGPPFCHLVLVVTLSGQDWLVDVGFGRNSRYPLRMASGLVQSDPEGEFALQFADDDGIDVFLRDKPLYRFYPQPCAVADFGPTLWWYQTSPESPFLSNPICSLPVPGGRVTIQDRTLIQQQGSERRIDTIDDDDELLALYEKWFGIRLASVPVRSSIASTTATMALG